ncbi:hypothetical protein [Methylocystis parvus]|uniref:Sulfur globule protein n=1 Tax=Methylocystis parvus TaxID=134 RepID=A0A6B8LVT3_9HYPH|nr:hypothetical protein [Methylocystis parvus]QGM96517.1 hypothetical protein F7D14_02810 [Methylocystis parvus]WBJ99632.1 hypothetical protein MMG94_16815 [Methylocystis parvus OBBP]
MFKKIAATTILVASLSSVAIVSTTAPAAAWVSDGAAAAIGVGAFAVGAMAAGGMGGGYGRHYYHDCYMSRRPVYNPWGDVVGFRRVSVCD